MSDFDTGPGSPMDVMAREEEEKKREKLRIAAMVCLDAIHELHTIITTRLGDVDREDTIETGENEDVIFVFFRNIQENPELNRFLSHDLGSILQKVPTYLELIRQKNNPQRNDAYTKLLQYWPRFYCATEDLVLRALADDSLDKKYCKNINVELMKQTIGFFGEVEVGMLKEEATKVTDRGNGSTAYAEIENKKFENKINFDELKNQLGDHEIGGNQGAVLNCILNILRNAMKDGIQATLIEIDGKIEGEEVVITISDDGMGMSSEQLDSNNEKYIFASGTSGTKSTGLGLADDDKRLASMGVSLRVYSRKRDSIDTSVAHFKNVDKEFPEIELPKNVNTIFEIRLPIVQKQAA